MLVKTLNSIEITSFNNKINFEEVLETELTATIPVGFYDVETLSTEIKNQLEFVGFSTYTVTFFAKKYTISSDLSGRCIVH